MSLFGMLNEVKRHLGSCVMFLDIAKAFNSIKHDFLEKVIYNIFEDSNFAKYWLIWTNTGYGHVSIWDQVSE